MLYPLLETKFWKPDVQYRNKIEWLSLKAGDLGLSETHGNKYHYLICVLWAG